MVDPLTALMYAVQVMNFLKTLIEKTLRERGNRVVQHASTPHTKPSDDNGHPIGHESPPESYKEKRATFVTDVARSKRGPRSNEIGNTTDEDYFSYSTCGEESDGTPAQEHKAGAAVNVVEDQLEEKKASKTSQSNNSSQTGPESRNNVNIQQQAAASKTDYLSKGASNLSRINSIKERCEAWR